VPTAALAFYGRWWQLENWLREVAYVELRARYGVGWAEHLRGTVQRRLAGDQQNSYMASADAEELLAYTDVSALFELIEDEWELFAPLLPPKQRWRGRADELRELRNRNAHCRRPHSDDLARLEQTLRDLEQGAWLFYSSYVDVQSIQASRDAVGRGWIRGRHPIAETLIGSGHAQRKYETRFWLGWTARPWAAPHPKHIAGSPGVLWHARWSVAGHELNVADLWRQVQRHDKPSRYLIHLLFDLGSVVATFAAIDDAQDVADAIGEVFDAVLESTHPFRHTGAEEWAQRSFRGAHALPRQVQVQGPFTTVDPYHPPFSLFET
jgi:Swt1-like HEPN